MVSAWGRFSPRIELSTFVIFFCDESILLSAATLAILSVLGFVFSVTISVFTTGNPSNPMVGKTANSLVVTSSVFIL